MIEPIYKSILDQDTYKFHMGCFFVYHHKGTWTEYTYKCRDPKINLECIYDDLVENVNAMSQIRMTDDEVDWLYENTFITIGYANWLRKFSFDPSQVSIERIDENPKIQIRVKGVIEEATMWEMPLMSTISELYFKKMYGDEYTHVLDIAKYDLQKKIESLKDIKFSEFGTRRRISFDFQDYAVKELSEKASKCLMGTSNAYFAKKYGLTPIGTQAHEAFMLYQALVHPEDSQTAFLKEWHEFYNGKLGIALTDTLGNNKWRKDFTTELMNAYTGQRHDSGDAVNWAFQRIGDYQNNDIDPKTKTLLFSDNLTFDIAQHLTNVFKDKINVVHGIGTFITNNIPSIPSHKALNQVIKLVRVNGRPVAKISADPMKAQCEDPIYLAYMKHIAEVK